MKVKFIGDGDSLIMMAEDEDKGPYAIIMKNMQIFNLEVEKTIGDGPAVKIKLDLIVKDEDYIMQYGDNKPEVPNKIINKINKFIEKELMPFTIAKRI